MRNATRIGIVCFNIGDRGVAKNWEKKYVAFGDVRKRRGTAASEEGRSQGVDSLEVNERFVEN
jgi:hypothetical protein